MVRHRLERLMRLTQGAALVAVAACNNSESKPGDNITNEAVSAAPSAAQPTMNATATPPTASAKPDPAPSAITEPAANASASAAPSASAIAPKTTTTATKPGPPIHINSLPPDPRRINSIKPPN